jgi:hypothetical protein
MTTVCKSYDHPRFLFQGKGDAIGIPLYCLCWAEGKEELGESRKLIDEDRAVLISD